MRTKVELRISPIWNPTAAELLSRAKERAFQTRQLVTGRRAEDAYLERIRKNLAARTVRKCLRFINEDRIQQLGMIQR